MAFAGWICIGQRVGRRRRLSMEARAFFKFNLLACVKTVWSGIEICNSILSCGTDFLDGFLLLWLGDVLSVVSVSYPSSSKSCWSATRPFISELETKDIASRESSSESAVSEYSDTCDDWPSYSWFSSPESSLSAFFRGLLSSSLGLSSSRALLQEKLF